MNGIAIGSADLHVGPSGGRVLLYSGGVDSYALLRMFDFETVLFFDIGTEDNARELEFVIRQQIANLRIVKLGLGQWELANKILPYRNHVLALAAANYGNDLTFGFTAGDTTKDKDYVFKSQIEGILNYFGLDEAKVAHDRYPFRVHMPFKGMTKTQIINAYLSLGFDADDLYERSRSCYLGNELECGKCRSCLRKIIGLLNNNVYQSGRFENEVEPGSLVEAVKESLQKRRSKDEMMESWQALHTLPKSKFWEDQTAELFTEICTAYHIKSPSYGVFYE